MTLCSAELPYSEAHRKGIWKHTKLQEVLSSEIVISRHSLVTDLGPVKNTLCLLLFEDFSNKTNTATTSLNTLTFHAQIVIRRVIENVLGPWIF